MPPVTPRTMWGVMVGAMFFALSLDLGFLRDFLFGQLVRGLLQDAPLRAVVPADPRLGELLGGELRRLHGAVRLELRARAPHQLLCAAGEAGTMKIGTASGTTRRMSRAPCTSMSRTTSSPAARRGSTSAREVP